MRTEAISVEILQTGDFRLEKYVHGSLSGLCCAREVRGFFFVEHESAESGNTQHCDGMKSRGADLLLHDFEPAA